MPVNEPCHAHAMPSHVTPTFCWVLEELEKRKKTTKANKHKHQYDLVNERLSREIIQSSRLWGGHQGRELFIEFTEVKTWCCPDLSRGICEISRVKFVSFFVCKTCGHFMGCWWCCCLLFTLLFS